MRIVALRTITEKIGSGSTPRGGEDSYAQHGTPLIRSLNVYDDRFREEGLAFLTAQQANDLSSVTVESGDVLLNITGASVARCCLAPDRLLPARVNQHVCIIRPTKAVLDSHYLQHLLISGPTKRRLLRIGESGGATRQAITKADLQNLEIPLPGLQDQKRIAAVLDAADNLRAKRRASIEQLESLVHAIFLDMFGDPVRNPKGWDVCQFGDLGDCRLGKMLDRGKQRGDGDYPYLANRNVRWGVFDLTELPEMAFSAQDRQEFRLVKGDLLICEGGEVGRTAIWREEREGVFFQKALHRLRLYPHKAVPEYLQYYMWFMAIGGGFRDYTTSATIAHLTGVKLKSLPCALPPIDLQSRFASIVEAVESHKVRLKSQYAELDTLFASLQSRAFSGELCSSPVSQQHASA